ncbi:MAG: outer membrane lipoprotein-sorting protein [Clostridia bacterium]|jgi:outer membrane lipoprotein-sorting protein|nr:outer membrane lipoprotein-sorting protein [Spirochaetia bacterium]
MKRPFILCIVIALVTAANSVFAQAALTGSQIMEKVDANNSFTTMAYVGIMEIDLGRRVLLKEMRTVAEGVDKSFVEFTNPEDRGVRYLKVEKNLWMYFPSEQETIRISGHLLKEGMMGSDVSYEDALESGAITDKYDISVLGTESLDGRQCYVLDLNAKVRTVNYERQKFWVDTERFVVLKSEMYAKSGKLLKESSTLEVKQFGTRWFTTRVKMEDKLKKGGGTIFTMKDIQFGVNLPEDMFSLQRLSR